MFGPFCCCFWEWDSSIGMIECTDARSGFRPQRVARVALLALVGELITWNLNCVRLFEGSKIERNISKDSRLSISWNIVKCKNSLWSLPPQQKTCLDASFTFGIWKQILNDFYNLGNDLSRGGQRDKRKLRGLDHWSNLCFDSKFHPNCIQKFFESLVSPFFWLKKGNKYLKPCKWETTSTTSWSRNHFTIFYTCSCRISERCSPATWFAEKCRIRAKAFWPHRRLSDLCPVLVRWWGHAGELAFAGAEWLNYKLFGEGNPNSLTKVKRRKKCCELNMYL